MSHRLKVLFITPWYPTKERPIAGVFVREHAKAARLRDDVVVLHCAGPKTCLKGLWHMEEETDETLTEGIPTHRAWYRHLPLPKAWYLVYVWSVLQAFRRIAAYGYRPHVIHAHVYEAGTAAVLVGKLLGTPVVVTEHSSAFPRRLLTRPGVWTARLAFRWADVVMPVSSSLQRAIEGYGIQARFRVVPNVVDLGVFHPNVSRGHDNHPKRLLAVSLLDQSDNKGIGHLLAALVELRKRRDDWQLDVVGDGPGRAQYESMAASLGLRDKVTFHGIKPKSEVAQFMRRAHVFVVPSLFETFCVAAAEALATGTPVVATRCGGPEDFIVEDTGMLVPPADAESLCTALADALDNPSRFSPRLISRYASQRFGPDRVGEQLHVVYERCVVSRAGPPRPTSESGWH